MSDLPHTGEDLPSRRSSLRVKPQRIDYSEDEFEDDYEKGRDKKRGSKRKAEVNIESLYCQENAKEVCVCPSLLETIFETPVNGANRRNKNARPPGKVSETESQLQMMSVKKWKRSCAFANFYHPSKQKVKVRKDRAKKMKQLTGVKVPKGVVSDDALKTILAVLSDEDDQNENIQSTFSCKSSSSFYVGNIIRPDIEDSSLNDVIENISSMKMVTDSSEERNIPHNAFMEGIDEPLPFTDEKQNTLPAVSHQKKSRRRSEKFSGILLPRALMRDDEEFDGLPGKDQANEDRSLGLPIIAIEEKSDCFEPDERTEVKTTPKRRNVLNDKKIVKKPKHQELTLKRQSESKEYQCQKKRGDMKFNVMKDDFSRQLDEHVIGNNLCKKRNAIKFDVENSSGIANTLSCHEMSLAQKQSNVSFQAINLNKSGFGKKPGRRRISGVQRPLYRKIIEIPSPEVMKSPNESPNTGRGNSSPFSCFNISNDELNGGNQDIAVVDAVRKNTPKTSNSPTSPCTQMAALSLQSEKESDFNLIQRNLKCEPPRRITRRRSAQLAKAPLFSPLSPSNPSTPLSSVVSDGERKTGFRHVYNSDHSSNVFSHSEPKEEVMAGLISSKKATINKNKGHAAGLAATKRSNCRTSQMVKSTCKSNVTSESPPENGPTYLSLKENIAVDMLIARGQITSQMLQNGNLTNAMTRLTPENHESSLDIKRSENVSSSGHQSCVKIDGETCEANDINKSLFVIDEDFDSPVITGMIGNKANIRCGKIYRNRLSAIESPIILAQLDKHKSKESVK